MKQFFLLITCLPLCAVAFASGKPSWKDAAAERAAYDTGVVVRGRVTDTKGEPLIGVNIRVKSGSQGTVTDAKGNYFLNIAANNPTLVFTYVGYIPREIVAKTGKLDVQLAEDPKSLNEVVVTALGIKRDAKSLGYSAPVVKGEQLTEALSNNWTDALSGKVPGVNLVRSNSGPTGSNRIILRGENGLSGNDEALIVVDGVVINNGSGRRTANAGEATYGTGADNMPADYGSGLNDINPEDIESLTVLKGPGAAALYGQRGANGAIIITTKSGSSKRKGIGVSLNSNGALESVNRWPDLQSEYGQGTNGVTHYSYGTTVDGSSQSGTSSAYGARFDPKKSFYQWDPVTQTRGLERTPWVAYPNNQNKYFQTGKTLTNTLTLDGGTEKTTARFSFTNVNNTWITPNTGYKRNTIALSVNSKINDKLTVASKVNYTNKFSDNLPGAGYGNQSLMYWYIFWQPNADLNWLKNYWKKGEEGETISFPFSSFPENPYAVAYEFINRSNRNGVTGNISATYQFTKDLSLMVRTSADMAYEQRAQERPFDAGAKFKWGSYRTQNIFSQEISGDFLLRYNKQLNRDFDISGTLGGSMLRNRYNRDEVRSDSLSVPGLYTHANSRGPLVTMPYRSDMAMNSLFGLVTGAYKDFLFLDVTARQDWNSVLATPTRLDNVGFFYTSVNGAVVLSEALKMPSWVSYAKLRLSAAGVGSGNTTPYLTGFAYSTAGSLYQGGGLTVPGTKVNPDLQPLYTYSYETGLEVKLLKNRLGFDLTLYSGNTRNQIITRVTDRASGFSGEVINAGKVRNKGVELALNGSPLKSKKGLNWNVTAVFSSNQNRIVELPDSSIVLRTGPIGGGQIVAKVGGSMGDLYGRGYQRAPDGQIIYDPSTGWAKITDEVVYLGNTIPKYKIGLTNEFSYRQFRFSFLFDAQYGAVAHSHSHHKLSEQGKLKSTLPGRYNGIIGNGVIQDADGKFRPNDVIATDIDYYYRSHWGIDNAEGNTFKTDFIKFREANLTYTVSPALAKRLRMQKLQLGVYGRNLFIWSPWPNFDPEFGTLAGTDIVQGFEIGQFPSTRSYGFNLVIGL
ncbi:SusC/RagA family TonB-linked outer membrane protein [Chitinophaga lutea]